MSFSEQKIMPGSPVLIQRLQSGKFKPVPWCLIWMRWAGWLGSVLPFSSCILGVHFMSVGFIFSNWGPHFLMKSESQPINQERKGPMEYLPRCKGGIRIPARVHFRGFARAEKKINSVWSKSSPKLWSPIKNDGSFILGMLKSRCAQHVSNGLSGHLGPKIWNLSTKNLISEGRERRVFDRGRLLLEEKWSPFNISNVSSSKE